jgi:hypothetical protein
LINENFPRAYPGGTGGVKSISNYPPVSYLNLQNKIIEVIYDYKHLVEIFIS